MTQLAPTLVRCAEPRDRQDWRRALRAMLVLVAAVGLLAQAPVAPDSPEGRRLAAERYLAAMPFDDIVAEMIRELSRGVPEQDRDRFVRLMQSTVRPYFLKHLTIENLVKHFTVDEIDAMTRFNASPEGRSILKKFGPYMADLMPAIQAELLRVAAEIKL
jgi:hypothetical protein